MSANLRLLDNLLFSSCRASWHNVIACRPVVHVQCSLTRHDPTALLVTCHLTICHLVICYICQMIMKMMAYAVSGRWSLPVGVALKRPALGRLLL